MNKSELSAQLEAIPSGGYCLEEMGRMLGGQLMTLGRQLRKLHGVMIGGRVFTVSGVFVKSYRIAECA